MSENKMKQKKSAKKPYLRYLNPRYRRSPRKTNPKYYHERSNSDTSTSTPKSIISEEVDIVTISPTCRNDEVSFNLFSTKTQCFMINFKNITNRFYSWLILSRKISMLFQLLPPPQTSYRYRWYRVQAMIHPMMKAFCQPQVGK